MSKHKILIARIPTTTPTQFLDVEVRYKIGGVNYATYQNDPRGYYLSITPITDKGDDCIGFTMFSGVGMFVERATRFSEKRLAELAEIIPKNREVYNRLIADVLEKNKLALAEGSEVAHV